MKITVYIPADLANDMELATHRGAQLNVSAICQEAIRRAVAPHLSATPESPVRCRCGHWDNLHLGAAKCQGMGSSWDSTCPCSQFEGPLHLGARVDGSTDG